MYHNLLTHSSTDVHLGCFHVLAIVNSDSHHLSSTGNAFRLCAFIYVTGCQVHKPVNTCRCRHDVEGWKWLAQGHRGRKERTLPRAQRIAVRVCSGVSDSLRPHGL